MRWVRIAPRYVALRLFSFFAISDRKDMHIMDFLAHADSADSILRVSPPFFQKAFQMQPSPKTDYVGFPQRQTECI